MPEHRGVIRTATVEVPREKEIKTHIRGDQHARILSLKAIGEGSMRETIERALDHYFEHLRQTRDTQRRKGEA